MKDFYLFARKYLLNGIYAYALFGFYTLTVAPIVTRFIEFGEKSFFVFIFGFTMLVSEYFAINFKLKMVKVRAEEKRIAYRQQTGIDIVPRPSKWAIFGLFTRMVFRVGVMMIALSALGIQCTGRNMSGMGGLILLVSFFFDMYGFINIYVKSQIYTDPPENMMQLAENEKEAEAWDKINLPLYGSVKSYWKEFMADGILQVYAMMLFTAFWSYLNQYGIDMLTVNIHDNTPALAAAINVFLPILIIFLIGLMPIRIAYWIEDSMMAFSRKEKAAIGIMFLMVCIFSCMPVILKFFSLYVWKDPESLIDVPYFYISLGLFLLLMFIILTLEIWLSGKKNERNRLLPSKK